MILSHAPHPPLRLLACSGSLDGGGSERQLWQLVTRLDRRRFAPEVYLLHKRGPYLEQLPADVPVHAFDTQYPAPSQFPPGRISRMQSRHLRQLVHSRGIDIVYDRTFHMSLLTGWALPARQSRVSVIVSPPSRDLPSSERQYLFIKRYLLKRAYYSATVTICVSDEVADDAAHYYGLNRERLTVLHNPVDVDTVRRLATDTKQCHIVRHDIIRHDIVRHASPGELHIAIVGRFTAEKGHRFAIEVLRAMRERQDNGGTRVHLHCVGDGPLKSEMQSLVTEWGLGEVVHQHGYQTNPYPFMRACDLVFVPSRYEGFPNVAMEAMALGVPLLMTDYGPTARMIAGAGEERVKLVPLDSVVQTAKMIVHRIGNAEAWQRRAVTAQAWIEREHALAPWLEKMMRLLEQAASGSAGRT